MIDQLIVTILFALGSSQIDSQKEFDCLATNIYFESRNQSMQGQFAVGMVTLNRVKDERFPNTICGVVKQGHHSKWWKEQHNRDVPIRNRCHFSWYCDGKADVPLNQDLWHLVQNMAYLIIWEKKYVGLTEGSTHYHAEYVNPRWASGLHLTGRVGKHIFYRWE